MQNKKGKYMQNFPNKKVVINSFFIGSAEINN